MDPHVVVLSTFVEQVVVTTGFYYSAIVQHENYIRVHNARESMRNKYAGRLLSVNIFMDRLENASFCMNVQ